MGETLTYIELETVVSMLNDIYWESKTLHWTATDYGDHLLYDRIAEGIFDNIDEIMEGAFIPFYNLPLENSILAKTLRDNATPQKLVDLLENAIEFIEKCLKNNDVLEAVKNILSNVSSELLVKQMLLRKNLQK